MIQIVINRFFSIKQEKERLSYLLFLLSFAIGILLFAADILIPHERTALEPFIVLFGSISIISYALMSFSNCIEVKRNKLPLAVKAIIFIICVTLLLFEVATTLIYRDDSSISLSAGLIIAYSILSILSGAYLHNGYQAKKNAS